VSTTAALLDLVLPRRCVGCGSTCGPLCGRCLPTGPVLRGGSTEFRTSAAAVYEGPVRAALLAYKERGRRDLAGPLAGLLARAVAATTAPTIQAAAVAGRDPPARVVLVPVPSARSVAAARGGNHVLRLARRAAAANGLRVASDALVLTRAVRDSAGLGSGERSANLAHAMAACRGCGGLSAVLVDDIVTTGSTLREARRALVAAGWDVLGSAVVAATQRRRPGALSPLAVPSRTV
jgi:predicted amidophosphoribosyltransferase